MHLLRATDDTHHAAHSLFFSCVAHHDFCLWTVSFFGGNQRGDGYRNRLGHSHRFGVC